MTLKLAFDREIETVKKTALAAAIKLGFTPGKGLYDAVYTEYDYWRAQSPSGKPWRASSRASRARVRCLEALGSVLDPLYIRDTDAIDYIKNIDHALAVLRRDGAIAAPAPDRQALRLFKREEKAQAAEHAAIAARAHELMTESGIVPA